MKTATYIFITNTDYSSKNLTGAHKRFLELLVDASKTKKVILISKEIPQIKGLHITNYQLNDKYIQFLPKHINKILSITKKLRRIKNAIKYDYSISFGPVDTICYGLSGYRNIVTLFREDYIEYKKALGIKGIKLHYAMLQEKYAVKHSQKIIVQCRDDKNNLIKRYGEDIRGKIYVQINNANASWIKKNNDKTKKHESAIRIAFIGNFTDKRKGHGILLPAMARIINHNKNVELVVAGDGKELQQYKNRYRSYSRIKFIGHVNNANELLNSCSLEIVPSLIDSCPNTLLEGLNAGIAVYGSNVGGIKDILKEKEYLFEPNSESIYSLINKVINEKRYISDAKKQKTIVKKLSFDWSNKIFSIIERNK